MNNTKKDITEADIYREAIIGFAVIKNSTGHGRYYGVYNEPICIQHDGLEDNINVLADHEIIGVLPAPPMSYRVYGFDGRGDEIDLGYEFPGAYHPDWTKELKQMRELRDEQFSSQK